MRRRTEVYTIPGFLRGEPPIRVEGGIPKSVKTAGKAALITAFLLSGEFTEVADAAGIVTKTFDEKIWPYFIDIGTPVAKTMMAVGIYKCIRGNADTGWTIVRRAGIGLVCLYLINGAVNILTGIGDDLANVSRTH